MGGCEVKYDSNTTFKSTDRCCTEVGRRGWVPPLEFLQTQTDFQTGDGNRCTPDTPACTYMSCKLVSQRVCYVCYARTPPGAWGMSARKISKCQKCMCVVPVFTGRERACLDTSFTFGNLIRSNHHGLYRFVSNLAQSLCC